MNTKALYILFFLSLLSVFLVVVDLDWLVPVIVDGLNVDEISCPLLVVDDWIGGFEVTVDVKVVVVVEVVDVVGIITSSPTLHSDVNEMSSIAK